MHKTKRQLPDRIHDDEFHPLMLADVGEVSEDTLNPMAGEIDELIGWAYTQDADACAVCGHSPAACRCAQRIEVRS